MGRSADVPRSAEQFDGDDTGCTLLHVDMDAFYASVEIRRDPDLRGKPVVVGGGVRGVVAAASYEARKYGIHSAMSMAHALRLCPRLDRRPARPRCLFGGIGRGHGNPARRHTAGGAALARRGVPRRRRCRSAARATRPPSPHTSGPGSPTSWRSPVRSGWRPTKFVAKLASAHCKPDGMLVVPVDQVLNFLHPLPVTVLWGVGARTAEPLHRLGVRTVADLADIPLDTLRRAVGVAVAEHLHALAHGRDPRTVQPHEVEKSISSDHTNDVDLTTEADVRRELLRLAGDVGERMRQRGWVARTVGIKIRFADFRTVTRVRTLPGWTDSTSEIYDTAAELYNALGLDQPRIRLVGVKCENFRTAGEAPRTAHPGCAHCRCPGRLAGARRDNGGSDRVVDAARAKFGAAAMGYGTLLPTPGRDVRGADPDPP